jgi:hypothetical protein
MTSGNLTSPVLRLNQDGIVTSRIWRVGLAAIMASVLANLLVLALVVNLVNVPADFPPLTAAPIALFTGVGVAAAVVVFALIARYAQRPIRTFWIVAVIALLVSIVPNILTALNPASAPFPGATAAGFLVLIVFHVVAAAICVPMLTSLTRTRRS